MIERVSIRQVAEALLEREFGKMTSIGEPPAGYIGHQLEPSLLKKHLEYIKYWADPFTHLSKNGLEVVQNFQLITSVSKCTSQKLLIRGNVYCIELEGNTVIIEQLSLGVSFALDYTFEDVDGTVGEAVSDLLNSSYEPGTKLEAVAASLPEKVGFQVHETIQDRGKIDCILMSSKDYGLVGIRKTEGKWVPGDVWEPKDFSTYASFHCEHTGKQERFIWSEQDRCWKPEGTA